MSNYVQKLKQDSINQFNKEMELRRFREKFKFAGNCRKKFVTT